MESSIEGARNLMAMGIAAKDVIPWLETIGNVSAALGGSSDVYSRIAYAIGQIEARGKLAGQEILQLANAGVNVNEVFEVMAEQTGKSVAELKKMQEQGQITSDMFLQAFQTWANTRFGDAMAQQAQTFSGALSNLGDTMRLLIIDAAEPLFNALKKVVGGLAELASSDEAAQFARMVKEAFQGAVNTVMDLGTRLVNWIRQHITFEDVARAFQTLVIGIRVGWEILKAVVSTVAQVIATTVRGLVDAFEPAANEARRAFSQMAQDAGQSGQTFAWWAGYVTGAIVSVIKAFGELVSAVATALGSILRIVVSVGTLIAKMLVLFLSPFSRHSPSLVEQVEMGVERISAAWQSLPGLVQGPLDRVKLLLQAVGQQAGEMAADVVGSVSDIQAAAMEFSMQLGSVGSTVEEFQAYFERTTELAGQVGQALGGLTQEAQELWDGFRNGSISVDEARQRLESIQGRLEQLGMPIDTVKGAFEELSRAIQDEIRAIDEQISALQQRMEDLARTPILGEGRLSAEEGALALQKQLLEAAIAAKEAGTSAEYVATLNAAIDQLNQALQKAVESGASPEQIQQLQDLKRAYEEALTYVNQDTETLQERLDGVNQRLEAARTLGDATFGAMHEALQGLTEEPAIEQPFAALVEGILQAQQEIDNLTAKRAELEELGQKVDEMAQAFGGAAENVQTLVERLDQVIPKLDAAAGGGGGGGGGGALDLAAGLDQAALNAEDLLGNVDEIPDKLGDIQGTMEEFNRGFQQAQEDLGNIAGTLQDVSGHMESIAGTLDRWSQKIDEITGKVENWKTQIETIGTIVSGAFAVRPGAPAQEQASGVDTLLTLLFGDDWEQRLREKVSEVWGKVTSFFTEKLPEAVETGKNIAGALGNGLVEKKDELVGKAGDFFGGISGWLDQNAATLQSWGERAGNEIAGKFGGLRATVTQKASDFFNGIQDWLSQNGATLQSWGQKAGDEIGNKFASLRSTVREKADNFFNGVQDWLNQNVPTLQSWGQKAGDEIGNKFASLRTTVKEKANDFFNGIQDWIASNTSTLTTWGENAAKPVMDRVANLRSTMKDKAGDLIGGIGDWISEKWNTLVGWGEDIVKAINQGLSNIKIQWPHIPLPHITVSWKSVGLPGGLSVTVPDFGIQWYARGGIAFGPSIVGIGEAGPEAILPLDRRGIGILAEALEAALGRVPVGPAGLTVTVHIGTVVASDRSSVERAGEDVAYAIAQALRRRGMV